MSCKLTYKGKRYNSEKELKEEIKKDIIFDNLETANEEEALRIYKASKDAENIRIGLNRELYIDDIPIIYQEMLVNSIISLISESSEIDKILIKKTISDLKRKEEARKKLDSTVDKKGTRELKKEARKIEKLSREEETIKKQFTNNLNSFISKTKIKYERNLRAFKLLKAEKFKGETLKFLEQNNKQNTLEYKTIKESENPLLYYSEELIKLEEKITIAAKAKDNADLLFNFARQKVKSFTLVNIKEGKKLNEDTNSNKEEELLDSFEDGQNTRETYQQDRTYQLNGKDQLTKKVKILLLGIRKAEYQQELENGEHKVTNFTFLGQPISIPFDVLYEQLTVIHALSYKDYSTSFKGENKFETLMNELKEHVPNLPYLQNVIDKLNKAGKAEQNAYATNMSRAPINHYSTYTSKITISDAASQTSSTHFSLTNTPTNSFNNSKLFLNQWKTNFFNMPFVEGTDSEDNVIFNKEELIEYFDNVKKLGETIKFYVEKEKNKLKRKYSVLGRIPHTIIKEIEERAKYPTKELLKELQTIFKELGMPLSTESIKILYTKGYYSKGFGINLFNIGVSNAGYFGALKKQIFNSKGEIKNIKLENNSLFNDSYVKEFAKFISKFDSSVYAASYKNAEGKTIYGFSLPMAFTNRMKALKTDVSLLKDLSEDVFKGQSLLLKEIYDKDKNILKSTPFNSFFDFFTFDANKVIGSNARAKSLNKLSKAGMEQVYLNFYYNKGSSIGVEESMKTLDNGKNYYYRNNKMFAPPFADKKRAIGLNSMAYVLRLGKEETKLNIDNVMVDLVLEEVVYPEYNRIRKEQINNNSTNQANHKEASSLFYFIPELNYSNNHVLYETDSTTKKIERMATGHIAYKVLKDLNNDAKAKQHLREIVYNHIQKLKDEKLEFWKESGIVVKNKMRVMDKSYKEKGYDTNPHSVAYEFVINYLISNANFFKLFAGDPAKFFKSKDVNKSNKKSDNKAFDYIYGINEEYTNENEYQESIKKRTNKVINNTLDNLVKRTAGLIAPSTPILGEYGEKMVFAVVEDIKGKGAVSSNISFYKSLFGEKKANRFYGNMDRTDAMGFSTFSEWLFIEHQRGTINEKEYNDLKKKDKEDVKLSVDDIRLIKTILKQNLINSYKPVYFNDYKDGKEFRTLYVKQSSLPLVEFLTRGTELDYLRRAMIRDNISNVVFASAVKTGQPKKLGNIFTKDGNIKEDISFMKDEEGERVLEDFVLTPPREGHGIQLDTPIHKDFTTDGSQQRNLILSDMLHVDGFIDPFSGEPVKGQRMRELIHEKYSEIFKLKSEQLKEELKYNEETKEIDLEEIRDILLNEFDKRALPFSDLEYLGLITLDNGKVVFKQPLWTSNLASKIESILVSIIDNRIRKLKVTGRSFILGSDVGFKPKKILEGEESTAYILENRDSIIMDKEWVERGDFILKGQRVENGVTLPAEVMIPSTFRNKKGNIIDSRKFIKDGFIDKEKIPDEMLEMFGYRIPTQSPNSIAYIKVVGFLPSLNSELIIAPAEFTAQMGSDFDIDKLYVQYYGYKETGEGNDVKIERDYPNTNKGEEGYTKDNHIESLINEILDIKMNILKNPNDEVQTKILTPLDDNIFKAFSEEIEEAIYNNTSFYSPFSQNNFQDKYLSGVVGNEAIGVFARSSILNSMLMNNVLPHHFLTQTGKERTFSMGVYEDGTRRTNIRLNVPKLSRTEYSSPYNIKERYTKADLLSMLVSSSVDNANEQILGKLNINQETYNFVTGSIMSGYDAEFIVNMLNQPIVLDYIKAVFKVKDSSITTFWKEDLVSSLSNKYGGIINKAKETQSREEKETLFGDLSNFDEIHFNYTSSKLRENINNSYKLFAQEGKAKEDFLAEQTAILYDFIKAENVYKSLTILQETTNIEGVQGFGNSVFYMKEKEAQIRDIESINISNASALLGETKIESMQNLSEGREKVLTDLGFVPLAVYPGSGLVSFIKPTTIVGSMAVYGLFLGNSIFNSNNTLYPVNNPVLSSLIEKAYNMIKSEFDERNLSARSERKKEALNHVKQFLFSTMFNNVLDGTPRSERQRLLISTEERPSFVKILEDIKNNNYNRFMNNGLLKRLFIDAKPIGEISSISFDATKEDTQLDFTGNAFISLLENTDIWYAEDGIEYTGSRIAMDLLAHQYVTSSIQFRKQFIKYLPISIFEQLGVNKILREIDFSKFSSNLRDGFEVQLAQHKIDSNISSIPGENFNKETESITIEKDPKKSYNKVMFSKIKGSKLLFIKGEETAKEITYNYIPEAGGDSFIEYDRTLSYIESIDINNNKVSLVKKEDERHNNNLIKEILSKDVIFEYNAGSIETPIWVMPKDTGSWEMYNTYLDAYKDTSEKIKLVSTKDNNNKIIIYDTSKFRGLFTFPSNVLFNSSLQEGTDYLIEEENTPLLIEGDTTPDSTNNKNKVKTFTDKFHTKYGFNENTDSETALKRIISRLKRDTKDVTKKYLYDLLLDATSSFIKENPNFKITVYENDNGGGNIHINKTGEIIDLNYNSRILLSNNEERIIVEELLHAYTLTKSIKNSPIFAELNSLREEAIEFFKNNNESAYKAYLKVEKYTANTSAIYSIITNTNISVRMLESSLKDALPKHKKTAVYRQIKDTIKREGENLNIKDFKEKLLSKYHLTSEERFNYYGLTNTGEFIASLFLSPYFQNQMNTIISKKQKLSVLERFINYIVKALKRLSINNVLLKRAEAKDTFFREGVNENSILEIGVAKVLLGLKTYKKSIYQAKEKTIIKKSVELAKKRKKVNISSDEVNNTFGLREGNILKYVKNANNMARMIKDIFYGLDVAIYKDNYIVVSPKNVSVDVSNMLLESKDNKEDFLIPLTREEIENKEIELAELKREKEEILLYKEFSEENEYIEVAESIKGRISKESAEKETGLKVGKDISRIYISKKGEGKSIESIAGEINKEEDAKYRDMIIQILSDGTLTNLRNTLLKRNKLSEINKDIRDIEQELKRADNSLDVLNNLEVNSINDIIPKRQSRLNNLKAFRIKKLQEIIRKAKTDRQNGINSVLNAQKEIYYTNILEDVKSTSNKIALERMRTLNDLFDIAEKDIKEVKNILERADNPIFSELIYTNKILNNWYNTFNLYFTSNEQQFVSEMVEKFNPIINEASNLLSQTLDKMKELARERMKEDKGIDISVTKSFEEGSDVLAISTLGYDISRFGHPLLDYAHEMNTNADNQSKREVNDKIKEFEELIKKVLPIASKYSTKEDGIFGVFFQQYRDGTSTGDLVQPFTEDFYSEMANLFSGFNSLSKEEKEKRYKTITKWFSNNTEILDINSLYNSPKGVESEKYRRKMVDILGEPLYNHLKELQDSKIEEYKKDKLAYIDYLSLAHNITNEFEAKQNVETAELLEVWEAEHSPFIFQEQLKNKTPKKVTVIENGVSVVKTIYNNGAEYSVLLPKLDNSRSPRPQLHYYDSNFKTILENTTLKEFYNYYTNTLKDLKKFLPPSARESMHHNLVPYIEKTFIENITDKGFSNVFETFDRTFSSTIDLLKRASREENLSNTKHKTERTLDYNLFKNHNAEEEEFISIEYAKYLLEHDNVSPSSIWEEEKRKEFIQKINKRKSKDLGKLLKTFIGLSLTYKHKSRVQDALLSTEIILNNLQELERNVDNVPTTDYEGQTNLKTKENSFVAIKDMYSYYLDVFHGRSRKKGEYSTNVKVLTKDEKARKKDLEDIIVQYKKIITDSKEKVKTKELTSKEYELIKENRERRIKEAEKMIEEMGGRMTGARVGDMVLKGFQLKGLGWNVIAGLNNMSFGIVANLVEAADGRIINEKEMYGAMKLVLNSVGRNFTFNKWEGVKGMALKIRNIMDRNDILNEASHELYTNSIKGRMAKKFGWALPYNIQRRTEYINQAPIMVAMYKKTIYTLEDGTEVSLFDAYDNNGKWKTEYGKEPEDFINKTNTKILQYIKLIHGNYHPLSAMRAKKTILGRAAVLFRSWFFEAYAQRLGKEVHDGILDIDVKGRYLSFHDSAKGEGVINYAKHLTMLFKDAILRTFGKSKDYNDPAILAVDSANMRKLVRELSIYLNLMAIGIALSLVFRDDDIPEEEQMALNLILNSINRTTTEMALYSNPVTFLQMVGNPSPAMSLVGDVYNIFKASSYLLVGEDKIETGRYAGESRLWRSFTRAIPGLSSYRNLSTSLQQEYKPLTLATLLRYAVGNKE